MERNINITRLGVEVVSSYCMVKAALDIDKADEQLVEKARKILEKYLSSEITYPEACLEAGSDRRFQAAVSYAKLILDIIERPQMIRTFHAANVMYYDRNPRYWDETEDLRLLGGVLIYGIHNFRDVAAFVGTGRGRAQCLQRWNRTLNPWIKRDKWTPNEDNLLIEIVNECVPISWTKIAKMLGDRTDVQCRYRYQQLMKKKTLIRVPALCDTSDVFTPYSVEKFLCCFA